MSKERILVVEDQADIATLLQVYFTSQGYEVLTAARGNTALELARTNPPHLALLDVGLPDMFGYEIARWLRSHPRTRYIPIIFLTAWGEKRDKLKGFEVQADDYIVKPFDIEEVYARVQRNLERAREKTPTHPVTHLPTSELINDALRQVIASDTWSVAMIHLANFQAFTSSYGALSGEDVLKYIATLVIEAVESAGSPQDFVGQSVTMPEFIIASSPERMPAIVEWLLERFDQGISTHYSHADRKRGAMLIHRADGTEEQVPFMTLAIGVLDHTAGPFGDIRELSEMLESIRPVQINDNNARSVVQWGRPTVA